MLEKQIVTDLIEILENGVVQVRTKTAILENGQEISSTYFRHVVVPGDDYSKEDSKVVAICQIVQTQAVIDAYKSAQATPITQGA